MATVTSSIPLPPPLKLTGSVTQNWKTFKSMWINYETATSLSEKDTEIRTATLLSCIGVEGFQLYQSLDFAEDAHRTNIDRVLERLERHCIGEVNETFERFKFNQRAQESNESIDSYVSALRTLVKVCNFGTLEDSLMRDRLVMGIRDDSTRKKLLQTRDLDLKRTVDICRASEVSAKQVQEMRSPEEVHKVQRAPRAAQQSHNKKYSRPRSQSTGKRPPGKCRFCGRDHPFKKELCPAFGKKCRKCSKPNHFESQCKSRDEQVNYTDVDSDDNYVLMLKSEHDYPKRLYASLSVGDSLIKFQLDSGASVNVLPESVFSSVVGRRAQLRPAESTLLMYDRTELKTSGVATVRVTNPKTHQSVNLDFYIVPSQQQSILGAAACQMLKLLTIRTENILANLSVPAKLSRDYILKEYHDVFSGTGRLPGVVHLETDSAVPPVKLPLRRLPLALRDKVKDELDKLVRDDILAKMDTPSDWISALLVVAKSDGRIRVCLDPKPLNKALKRNHHPLPIIDDIIPDLQGAKVFSTVDTKNGFWHCVLDDESSTLTTFETPFGKYRWKRLPFGLSVSPEEFTRRLNAELSGLPGIATIADDVLVYGRGDTRRRCTSRSRQEFSVTVEKMQRTRYTPE